MKGKHNTGTAGGSRSGSQSQVSEISEKLGFNFQNETKNKTSK